MFITLDSRQALISTGGGELTPEKPHKDGVRWSKAFGRINDEGTVDEALTSDPSGRRGCQHQGNHERSLTRFS